MKLLTGKQIKKKREEHDLSQKALAEAIGLKSASYISFIEGGYKPENEVLEALTKRLNKPVPPETKKVVAAKQAKAKEAAKKKAAKARKAKKS